MRKLTIGSHLLTTFAAISMLAFLSISFYYIFLHHVSPLSRDQWHMYAPYFEKGLWEAMLSPMSTHRHFFPYLIFHADMEWFHGNNHLLVVCGTLFNTTLVLVLISALWKEANLPRISKMAITVFVTCQMFWLIDIAQLGWGFMSTQYYLAILCLFLSIVCAHRYYQSANSHTGWIFACLLCGFISTFSFGMGILTWPILLYFFWGWRATDRRLIYLLGGFGAALVIFLALPGGDSIQHSIAFSFINSFQFIFQINAGPVFHLFKSWRILDSEQARQASLIVGYLATASGLFLLARSLLIRRALSGMEMLAHALLLTGIGTAALISLTRLPFFLDPWVDRYQIWAILSWTGLIILGCLYTPLKIKHLHTFLMLFCLLFPLLAIPSQLDFGARLYEYKIRMQKSLVFYQLGIAEKNAAEEALHWNWEHKLPYFFYTLEQLRAHEKNIFNNSSVYLIGHPVQKILAQRTVIRLNCLPVQNRAIRGEDLLNFVDYPQLKDTPGKWITQSSVPDSHAIVARQIMAVVPNTLEWEGAISTSEEDIVNGAGIHIRHSILPRPTRSPAKKQRELYGLVYGNAAGSTRWYLLGSGKDKNRIGYCELPNTGHASSR